MGEVVKIVDYDNAAGAVEDRVTEWESGLPSLDDLTPLSQALIPPELASAFKISPEPSRSLLDVNLASQNTLSSIRLATTGGTTNQSQALSSSNNFKSLNDETTTTTTTATTVTRTRDHMGMDIDDVDLTREGSDSRKTRRITEGGATEEADSAAAAINGNTIENGGEDGSARTLKRPRLVWTPQLHKRFVDVVAHLGIKSAVPKTIMQLMNVGGLTRENVASHLQKYRLYLKRVQGLSTEDPSPSDHLFASTPVPQSLHESTGQSSHGHGHGHANDHSNAHLGLGMPIPIPYPSQSGAQMVPMPMMGMTGHMGMPGPATGGFPGYESHHHHHHPQYGMMQQQRDWSGNKFGSVAPYPHHVPSNDN